MHHVSSIDLICLFGCGLLLDVGLEDAVLRLFVFTQISEAIAALCVEHLSTIKFCIVFNDVPDVC